MHVGGRWLVTDQRAFSDRPDVLTYVTDPLTEPLRIAGVPTAHLVASTTGTDSDWVVKLIDVFPDEVPSQPEMGGLKVEGQRLRDAVKYGDPLYFAKQFGRGRVTLMTTTAGEQWTNWPSGSGAPGWVAIVKEMQNYLSGGPQELHSAILATQSAGLDFEMFLQVRNKVVSAYEEIMRMQV